MVKRVIQSLSVRNRIRVVSLGSSNKTEDRFFGIVELEKKTRREDSIIALRFSSFVSAS